MPGLEGSLNFHTGHTALKTNGGKFSGDQEENLEVRKKPECPYT